MTDDTEPSDRPLPSRLLEAGTQLGKYKLIRLLGEGGMGQVWAAHDPDLERQVAVKLLRAAQAAPQLRTRLLREARAMARLKHPNVLTVYEVGSVGDRDYIAMELVDGTNLDQWLATSPPRADLWHALLAAGRGLAAAHRAGLVHRDFKPHNVLRSTDARVLVTDFGLARGVADEPTQAVPTSMTTPIALDVTLDAGSKDSVLDSPLTQTGALIGTPAYMAPEQYLGRPPDPRTDQFAFCVTAWQALTGERPFSGSTLDELRRATNRGAAHLKTKLPRRVRAALLRGLDPDPDRRWDGLDELLAALERAHGVPRSRWRYAPPIFAFVAAGLLFVASRRERPAAKPASPYACQPPEEAFSEAWTSERRDRLEARVGTASALVANTLDELHTSWIKSYATACAAPPSPATFARLGCLLGERDEVAAFTRLADTLMPDAFDRLDLSGVLPRVEACASDSPVAPPLLPQDRKQRDKIVSFTAVVAELRLRDPQKLVDQAADLERKAKALGWEPLVPQVDESIGAAAQVLGHYTDARSYLTRAAERAAQLHDYRLEATARIALLETETDSTAQPGDADRETRLVQDARDAVHRAGDDPELADSIDVIVAGMRLERGDLTSAEPLLTKDWWGATKATSRGAVMQLALRMKLYMLQGRFEQARSVGLLHEQTQTQAGPGHALIEKQMSECAWRLGDLEEVHARMDKRFDAPSEGGYPITLVVVDDKGVPVPHARVVSWGGMLRGDARRIYTAGDFTGDVSYSNDAGEVTVLSEPGWVAMAERDDLRSLPMVLADSAGGTPMKLVAAPVHAIRGKVTGPDHLPPLNAIVRYDAGDASWVLRVPISSDSMFRIAGLPAGAGRIGLDGDLDHTGRTVLSGPASNDVTLAWPVGPTLDVIVPKSGEVYVVHGHVRPHIDGARVDFRQPGPSDIANVDATPIGFSTATAEGRKAYQASDFHVVVRDVAPGPATACLVNPPEAKCIDVTVPPGNATIAVRVQ